MKVLETAVGAIFAPRFSLVRISVRDLVEDGKSLLRNSGVGGEGEHLILRHLRKITENVCLPGKITKVSCVYPENQAKIGVWVSGAEIQTSAVDARTAVWVSTA